MQKRKFDELISYFNRKVSDMSIDQKYKMELLGMISAIGFAHEKELGTDCISRRSAIDALRGYLVGKRCPDDGTLTCRLIENEVINKLPPIQPKRGKWIKTARWGRVYYCDQCRNYLDFDGVNAGRGSTNYCPNCGCRMDGGE